MHQPALKPQTGSWTRVAEVPIVAPAVLSRYALVPETPRLPEPAPRKPTEPAEGVGLVGQQDTPQACSAFDPLRQYVAPGISENALLYAYRNIHGRLVRRKRKRLPEHAGCPCREIPWYHEPERMAELERRQRAMAEAEA